MIAANASRTAADAALVKANVHHEKADQANTRAQMTLRIANSTNARTTDASVKADKSAADATSVVSVDVAALAPG